MHHTPGPWLYDYRDNQALIVDSQGFTVVELNTLENSTAHSALADNARLIAAAPDLLTALQLVLAMPEYDGTQKTSITRRDAKRAARAAINKATGE